MTSDDSIVDPAVSARMKAIRGKDTKPEMIVRRLVHRLGYRFRLHRPDLPGTPDLVFPRRRKAIFVHGCFWHRHEGCRKATMPKSNRQFWRAKFEANRKRDAAAIERLGEAGWAALVVWECETGDLPDLMAKLDGFLSDHAQG